MLGLRENSGADTSKLARDLFYSHGVNSERIQLRFELQPGLGVSAQKHNLVAEGVIASAHVRHPTASLEPESAAELARLRQRVAREQSVTVSNT